MDKFFEVGKVYEWYAREYDPFLVVYRTPKTITVVRYNYITFGGCHRLKVRKDEDGVEWVTDSCVPKSYRHSFTSSALMVSEEDKGEAYKKWKI